MFELTDEQVAALVAILEVSESEVLEPFLTELLRYEEEEDA